MSEPTKIVFHHRKIRQISDYSELIEMLFPRNHNQQHAAACMFFELKWAKDMVPNFAYMENKYNVSRRILQRTRAKLSRLGIIEHISYLNNRYGGQWGWKLSSHFESSLRQLAQKCSELRNINISSKEKDQMLIDFLDAKREITKSKVEVI